jgi:hypothetical protein
VPWLRQADDLQDPVAAAVERRRAAAGDFRAGKLGVPEPEVPVLHERETVRAPRCPDCGRLMKFRVEMIRGTRRQYAWSAGWVCRNPRCRFRIRK